MRQAVDLHQQLGEEGRQARIESWHKLAQVARKIPVLESRTEKRIWEWLKQFAHTFEQISDERMNLMSRLQQIALMSDYGKTAISRCCDS
jgi:hypothetical protein